MAAPAGLEPAIPGLEIRCPILLGDGASATVLPKFISATYINRLNRHCFFDAKDTAPEHLKSQNVISSLEDRVGIEPTLARIKSPPLYR